MLGVDRGISAFVRYNLLKRRGDSYVALPAGRFEVRDRWESDLVRELNGLLDDIDRQIKSPPAEFDSLRRQVDEAIYNVLLRGGDNALEEVAASVGRLYRRILLIGKEIWIAGRLSRTWVTKLSGKVEARISAALAGMWDRDASGMVAHLDRRSGSFSWTGANLEERMARTLERRMQLAEQNGLDRNPLGSAYRCGVGDVTHFLEGTVDDDRIEELLFAFTLVDWRKREPIVREGRSNVGLWPVYALLKHLFCAEEIETGEGKRYLIADMSVLAALTSGDVARAARVGSRRLQNAGVMSADLEDAGGFEGMRLAAALLIPVPYGPAMQRFFKTKTGERQ
jgi:CRISPR-associated protein Csx17